MIQWAAFGLHGRLIDEVRTTVTSLQQPLKTMQAAAARAEDFVLVAGISANCKWGCVALLGGVISRSMKLTALPMRGWVLFHLDRAPSMRCGYA